MCDRERYTRPPVTALPCAVGQGEIEGLSHSLEIGPAVAFRGGSPKEIGGVERGQDAPSFGGRVDAAPERRDAPLGAQEEPGGVAPEGQQEGRVDLCDLGRDGMLVTFR